MIEAFTVLRRAIQDAERRLRQYEQEGRKSEHKLLPVRHAIRELNEGYTALQYMYNNKLELVRLWNKIEEGNREHVQVRSTTKDGRGSSRNRSSNRRRT